MVVAFQLANSRLEGYIRLKVPQKVETQLPVEGPFRVGEWLVEPRLKRLTRGEESIQIELKMMDVLVCLAEHPGELVERQQLIDTVWATEFISVNVLTRAIAQLRNVLGDDARDPAYIETIHRKGYRLVAHVDAHPGVPLNRALEEGCCRLIVGDRHCYLRQGVNLIGRAADADVMIEATNASRHHATITATGTMCVVEDLKSKNGIFLEGKRIREPTLLNNGDGIRIGDTLLVFRVDRGPGSTVTDQEP